MTERHYVGVYWGDRLVAMDACIAQARELLGRLASFDPLFARWFVMRDSREASLAAEASGEGGDAALRRVFEESLATTGAERYGYSATLWNGAEPAASAKMELGIGSHLDMWNCPAPNSCVLELPRGEPALLEHDRVLALLSELARFWSADWGVASTDEYLRHGPSERGPNLPRVGWMTFLHASRGRIRPPRGARAVPVDGAGTIVTTGDASFSSGDEGAVERAFAVETALEKAGVLYATGSKPPARAAASHESGPYEAALELARAADAMAARIPARRADLADALARATTALVVAIAAGDDDARAIARARALVDLVAKLGHAAQDDLEAARDALERVESV